MWDGDTSPVLQTCIRAYSADRLHDHEVWLQPLVEPLMIDMRYVWMEVLTRG